MIAEKYFCSFWGVKYSTDESKKKPCKTFEISQGLSFLYEISLSSMIGLAFLQNYEKSGNNDSYQLMKS
jgi:hypothetical protein